jgi:lysophospholipase L1-like esterase
VLWLALAVSACASPTKPSTPPVDPYPEGPHILCPATPDAFTSRDGQSMSIQYGTPTSTSGAPPVSIACTPASGSLFPIGTTHVGCTATDGRQRTDVCAFNVSVLAPPKLTVTRFVAFGDSITWGENGAITAYEVTSVIRPHFQVPKTYPTVLYQSLATRYTTQGILVSNQGIPGEYAKDADTQARFSSIVRSGGFDVVLLMEGSNDLGDGFASSAIAALRSMVRNAKANGVKPFLATVPPMDGSSCCPRRGSAAPLVPGFNDQIRGVASDEGIPLVDVYGALSGSVSQYIGPDGLHPNDTGYQKIGETFFNAVKTNLEVKSSTTRLPTTTTLAAPAAARPGSPVRQRR